MRKWSKIRGGAKRPSASRSTLRRFEWGTAGRHRRRNRRAAIAVGAVVAAAAIGGGVWFSFFPGSGGAPPAADHEDRIAPPGHSARLRRLHYAPQSERHTLY